MLAPWGHVGYSSHAGACLPPQSNSAHACGSSTETLRMSSPLTGTWWTELRIFLQVAHAGSYHKAAQELGLTHPTVQRAVGRLEDAMGVKLVAEATGRGVKLTGAGTRLAHEMAAMDLGLANVLRGITDDPEAVQTT